MKLYNKYPCTLVQDKGDFIKVKVLQGTFSGRPEVWTYPKRDITL